MNLADTHGGFHGKSLQQQIIQDLDQAVTDLAGMTLGDGIAYQEGLVDGIAHALGVLRNTSMETEIEASKERLENGVIPDPNPEDMQRDSEGNQICCPMHGEKIVAPEARPEARKPCAGGDLGEGFDEFEDNEFDDEWEDED